MQGNNSYNKRLMRNTAFLYVRMLLVMFLAFYTTRVVLQVLGVEDYGIYNVVAGFVSMMAVLNSCLTTGTNRFYNVALGKNDKDGVSNVYKASLYIQLIIILVILILAETAGLWYINEKMVLPAERLVVANWLYQFSVFTLLLLVIQTPYSAAVLAYERMDFYAVVSIIDAVLKLAIVFAVRWLTYDKLLMYGLLMLVISVVRVMMYVVYCRKNFKELALSRPLDKPVFRSLLSFSGWSTLDPFSYIVRDQGSNMTLNLFFGPIVNAAYGIAVQISGAVSSFSSNLSVAFRPQIIQAYSSGDFGRAKNLMLSMSKINLVLQSMFAIPLVFELPYVLNIWLGADYPEYTVIFSTLVIAINTFNTLNEPVSIIMVASGKIKKIKSISLLIICSIVPIGYVLLRLGMPPYSIYLVMFTLTLLNQISCVNIMCEVFTELKRLEYVRIVAIPCLFFVLLSLIVPVGITTIIGTSFVRLVITFALSMIMTALIAYVVCFDATEKQLALNIVNTILKKVKIKK